MKFHFPRLTFYKTFFIPTQTGLRYDQWFLNVDGIINMVNFLISFLLHLMTLNLDDAIKKLEVRIYSIVTNLT